MDARPKIESFERAFGLSVTVTRPQENSFSATGIWISSLFEDPPVGGDFTRREPRRVMAFSIEDISDNIPRGTIVTAPEEDGGTSKKWQVDGIEARESDHIRVVLIPLTAERLWN